MNLIPFFSIARDSSDSGVLKNRGVKMSRLFGLAVEPQTRCDFLNVLHKVSSTPGKSSLRAPCFTAIYRVSVACGFKSAQMEWPRKDSWSSDQISQGYGLGKLPDDQDGTRSVG
jgi:hypothetical protein